VLWTLFHSCFRVPCAAGLHADCQHAHDISQYSLPCTSSILPPFLLPLVVSFCVILPQASTHTASVLMTQRGLGGGPPGLGRPRSPSPDMPSAGESYLPSMVLTGLDSPRPVFRLLLEHTLGPPGGSQSDISYMYSEEEEEQK
jgi:hypothetical protein